MLEGNAQRGCNVSKFDSINRVTVMGAGLLGSQIAMQAAFHGKEVVIYDAFPEALDKLSERWEWMRNHYQKDLGSAYSEGQFEDAVARVSTSGDLAEALKDADIVIEAVPENLELKRKVWKQIGEVAPAKTLFATNTSSLLPSTFAEASGHPEKLVAIHYANMIWINNLAEVMGTEQTSDEAVDGARKYAEETGMVVSVIHKEQPGYFTNSLLIPFLHAAGKLYINGVGDPEEIDRNWSLATSMAIGPFAGFDIVGFRVAANIASADEDPDVRRFGEFLQKAIEEGYTGRENRQGFYYYDEDGNKLGAVEKWNRYS